MPLCLRFPRNTRPISSRATNCYLPTSHLITPRFQKPSGAPSGFFWLGSPDQTFKPTSRHPNPPGCWQTSQDPRHLVPPTPISSGRLTPSCEQTTYFPCPRGDWPRRLKTELGPLQRTWGPTFEPSSPLICDSNNTDYISAGCSLNKPKGRSESERRELVGRPSRGAASQKPERNAGFRPIPIPRSSSPPAKRSGRISLSGRGISPCHPWGKPVEKRTSQLRRALAREEYNEHGHASEMYTT